MSDLRNQLLEQMTLHGLAEHTKTGYISNVIGLAQFYNQSPDTLTDEQVRDYFRHLLLERKVTWGTCKSYLCGIIFFFRHVCNREVTDRFGLPPKPRGSKLPVVFSMEEVTRLLSCVDNLKHRVLLKTMYSAGLRVGEVIRLKAHHIESDPSRMLIRVEQGKGRKDRYTVLSQSLLAELRAYWHELNRCADMYQSTPPDLTPSFQTKIT
ncbi:tyrosine-type recombinase/integrase [Thermodesulfobacteriota bacterium]